MLHITPDMCVAGYELLRITPPFRGHRLPPADEVSFVVFSSDTHGGDCSQMANGTWRIRINGKWHGTLDALLKTLAHEMGHLVLDMECPNDQAHHGKRFWDFARRICRHHVFDLKRF